MLDLTMLHDVGRKYKQVKTQANILQHSTRCSNEANMLDLTMFDDVGPSVGFVSTSPNVTYKS